MSNSKRLAASQSSRATSDAFELAGSSSGTRPASGAPMLPVGVPNSAETTVYKVPRELIEIARANARNRRAPTGTLTPIAPRPDAEGEASAKAYAAQVSEAPASPRDLSLSNEAEGSAPPVAMEPGSTCEPSAESGPRVTSAAVDSSVSSGPQISSAAPTPEEMAALMTLAAEVDAAEAPAAAPRVSLLPAEQPANDASPVSLLPRFAGVQLHHVALYVGLLVTVGYCARLLALAW